MTRRAQRSVGDYAEACPNCRADLRGEAIPAEHRHRYPAGAQRFSRVVGIVERDRVVAWRCPDCRYEWRADHR